MKAPRNLRRGFAKTLLALAAAVALLGPAGAQTAIRFSLDGSFEGPSAPFLVALDKGYFKSEGLAVTIDAAANPLESINRVASGAYQMALGDINTLIKLRDAAPATAASAVFMVYNKPAFSIISRKSRGVEKPKDLEGKALAAPAADSTFAQWKIFVQANGIDPSKVKIENVGVPVREPMLQNGQVDAITGLSFSSYVNLKSMGVPVEDIVVMLMADHGVDLYGNAVIVNSKFAAENPEAVKGFLRAFLKGLKDTVRDPAMAVDSVITRNDAAKKPIELDRLRLAVKENIVTPEVKAHGYGGVDNERLARAIDQIALTHEFKSGKPKPADVFDASFLPPVAERKAH